jgi:hypothetical protein
MITNIANGWRAAIACLAGFCTASCVTSIPKDEPRQIADEPPLNEYEPPLLKTVVHTSVAVIEVRSARYYRRDECINCWYSSPPAFQVKARVVAQLYGPPLDASIIFDTHSHWGRERLTRGGNLKLVRLISDGVSLQVPAENEVDVGTDVRNRLIVPAYPYGIQILPCGTDALREPVTIRTPSDRFGEPRLEYDDSVIALSPPEAIQEEKEDDRIYYRTEGKQRYPRYGIPIDSIAKFLQAEQPSNEDFHCFEY